MKDRIPSFTILAGIAMMAMSACVSQSRQSRHSRWLEAAPAAYREKLRVLRKEVMNDPAVRNARERRKRVNDEYHDAIRAAILNRDPSMAPVLDKMRKRQKEQEKKQEGS